MQIIVSGSYYTSLIQLPGGGEELSFVSFSSVPEPPSLVMAASAAILIVTVALLRINCERRWKAI